MGKSWSAFIPLLLSTFPSLQAPTGSNYGYGIARLADGIVAGGGMYGQGVCADLNRRRVVAFHCFDPHGKTSGLNGFCAGLKD